jgi:hypothetical protein
MERNALEKTEGREVCGRKTAAFKFNNNQIAILNY